MKRINIKPRADWQKKVEEQGLTFHSIDGLPYWHESAYYKLTSKEVDTLEAAANDLHMMCIDAAEYVIKENLWKKLCIPDAAVPVILKSWERDDFSLYGRFDMIYNTVRGESPKMLEYNADTPTALLEAAVVQWYWMKDCFNELDQFNSLHERLIDAWKVFANGEPRKIYLSCIKEHLEDAQTVLYLQDTCLQAGLENEHIFIDDIGWDSPKGLFVDLNDKPVENLFKLYPWEWMWTDEFSRHLALEKCRMIEPAWKMLLSNKGILPVLWKLFPNHQNLLPAYFSDEKPRDMEDYVVKPIFGREGANVRIVSGSETVTETDGPYGEEGFIIQKRAKSPDFDGYHPVMGVWVVNHVACGLGIREDKNLITGNCSLFTPHVFS